MSTVATLGAVILVLAFLGMLLFSRWRMRTIGLVLAGITTCFAGGAVWFFHAVERALETRNGPRHVFSVNEQTHFLDEAVVLERAQETLLRDGFTNGIWQPAKDGRTSAPGGRADVYLVRNAIHPLRGYVVFTNADGTEAIVRVSMEGTNLICQRILHK